MVPLEHVLALSAALFAIGAFGVLVRRNLLVVLMSLELMLNAVNLALVAFNRVHPTAAAGDGSALDGQFFALLVVTVAAAEVAVALGMVIALVRNRDSLDVDALSVLKW